MKVHIGCLVTHSLFFLTMIRRAQASIFDWHLKPYESAETFETRAEFGTNQTLVCADERFPEKGDGKSNPVKYWILPDLNIMRPDDEAEVESLEGTCKWSVSSSGMELKLINIDKVHFGFYYCIIEYDRTDVVIKKALNYRGPDYGDLWAKYKSNTIVGACAVGVVLTLVLLAYAVNMCFCPKRTQGLKEGEPELLYVDGNPVSVVTDFNMDPHYMAANDVTVKLKAPAEHACINDAYATHEDPEISTQL